MKNCYSCEESSISNELFFLGKIPVCNVCHSWRKKKIFLNVVWAPWCSSNEVFDQRWQYAAGKAADNI